MGNSSNVMGSEAVYVDFTSDETSFRAYFPLQMSKYTVCIMQILWNGKPQGTRWDSVAIKNPKDEYNIHTGRRVAAKKAIEKFATFYYDSYYSKPFLQLVKTLNTAFRHAYRDKFEKYDKLNPVGQIEGGMCHNKEFLMGEK